MKLIQAELCSAIARLAIHAATLLALCVAFTLGCGGSQSAGQPASSQTSQSRATTPNGGTPTVAKTPETASAASSTALLVPTSTPGPFRFHESTVPYSPGVPTLDENIFHADVIAWVRSPTVTNRSKTLPSGDGVAPTYRPFVEFDFEVVEYLKGSGESALTVETSQIYTHTYLTEKEALGVTVDTPADRTGGKRRVEGVVFLQFPDDGDAGGGASTQSYRFLKAFPVDTSEKSWLPAVDASAGKSTGASPDAVKTATPEFLNTDPVDGIAESSELTLEYLRSRIKAVADMVAKGEGIEGYEECIAFKFSAERMFRANDYKPKTVEEGPFGSGLPAGTEFRSSEVAGAGYAREWYEGQDADLFQVALVVDGVEIIPDYIRTRNDLTGYKISTRVARPLPGGTYEVKEMGQIGKAMPCNFKPDPNHAWTWIFTFEAPDTAIHEAFFDPAAIGEAAVGADAANGVLKPTAFTFGGADVSLDSIRWESQAAEMRLSPHTRLANHHADFIALDGSVALRLDFDDAAETGEGETRALSWAVCAQPWQAGDLLMLRISESPSDLSGVSRDADCVSATAVPATPTVAPTATPEAATPTPTVAPVQPTPTPAPEMDTPTPTATPIQDMPTATPEADAPTPAPTATPEMDTPTPAPDTPTPTATPTPDTPTPAPATPTVAPTPEMDTPTPTVAPVPPTPTATPEMDTPTATPEADTPTPTPTPAA